MVDAPLEIVLVEDDIGDALLVREHLADGLPNASLVHVTDVSSALREIQPRTDCVLLDLGLPDAVGMSGLTTLIEAHPHVPVIVLTGADSIRVGIDAVAAGAQDYLVKGRVDDDSLARSVRYAIERRRAQEAWRMLLEAEHRRVENARIQRSLLPAPIVESTDIALSVRYRPGRDGAQLGGDFYDAVELEDGTLKLMIGDVSGHGPDEAALGVQLRSAWRALAFASLDPHDVLSILDAVLRTERHEPTVFATVCTVDVDADRRRASALLAGHPPPLLVAGEPRPVGEGAWGPLLGVIDRPKWDLTTIELPPAWSLLLYTDGLFEGRAAPASQDRLGEPAVRRQLGAAVRAGSRGGRLLDELLTGVENANGGPLSDDIALCLVEHQPERAS